MTSRADGGGAASPKVVSRGGWSPQSPGRGERPGVQRGVTPSASPLSPRKAESEPFPGRAAAARSGGGAGDRLGRVKHVGQRRANRSKPIRWSHHAPQAELGGL